MKESVNIYTSTCYGVPSTKPPCVKPKAQPTKSKKGRGKHEFRTPDKAKTPEFSTLGSWRCGQCGKPCKVSVMPRPPKEEAANAGPQED